MKSYTNAKLRKKLQNKGITLDERKKQHFDKYSYYQVINAYKNIFSTRKIIIKYHKFLDLIPLF